jgi:hypothetical protein
MTPPPEAPEAPDGLNHRAKVVDGIKNHKFLSAIIGVVLLLALVAGVSYGMVTMVNNHNQAVATATARHHREVAAAHAKAHAAAAKINNAIAAANARAANAAKAAAEAQRQAKNARQAANRAENKPAPAPVVVQVPAPAAPALTGCGIGVNGEEVYAGGGTSCPFALNVEQAYSQSGAWQQTGTSQFSVYSPITGETYLMTSSSVGDPVVVTGGNNAYVQFNF